MNAHVARSLERQMMELGPRFEDGWRKLPSFVRFRFPSLSAEDVQDVVTDSVISVLAAVSRMPAKGESIEYPAAYLRQVATRAAYAKLVQRTRNDIELDGSIPALSDEAAAAAFDSAATVMDVKDFLRQLSDDGDPTAYKVLSFVLDAVYLKGATPSTREIAKNCDLSHTGVAKALKRIRLRFERFYADDE